MRGVLGPTLRGVILDLESAAAQALAQQAGAVLVELPRRVHGGDANQVGGESHHLVGEGLNFPQDALARSLIRIRLPQLAVPVSQALGIPYTPCWTERGTNR